MKDKRSLAERRAHQRQTGDPRYPFYFGTAITALSAMSIVLAILAGSWTQAIGPTALLLLGLYQLREFRIMKSIQNWHR